MNKNHRTMNKIPDPQTAPQKTPQAAQHTQAENHLIRTIAHCRYSGGTLADIPRAAIRHLAELMERTSRAVSLPLEKIELPYSEIVIIQPGIGNNTTKPIIFFVYHNGKLEVYDALYYDETPDQIQNQTQNRWCFSQAANFMLDNTITQTVIDTARQISGVAD